MLNEKSPNPRAQRPKVSARQASDDEQQEDETSSVELEPHGPPLALLDVLGLDPVLRGGDDLRGGVKKLG